MDVAVLQKLHRSFGRALEFAESSLSSEAVLYVLYVPPEGRPELNEFGNTDEGRAAMHRRIMVLRDAQDRDPDVEAEHSVFIFRGQRLLLQKGANWRIYDGQVMTLLAAENMEDLLDFTGSLREPAVLPEVPDTEDADSEPVDEDPAADAMAAAEAALNELAPPSDA